MDFGESLRFIFELALVVTKWYAIVTTQARNETTKYLQNLRSGPKMVVFEIFFLKNDRSYLLTKFIRSTFVNLALTDAQNLICINEQSAHRSPDRNFELDTTYL